jgi:bacterioferritin B
MLISKAMNEAINEQIGNEFGASLQYVSIATYFDNESLPVLAQHFYAQADEERDHAMRFVKYVVDTGGQVKIPAINAPKSGFGSAEAAVQLALDSELNVTRQINGLMDLAHKESDHLSTNTLQWFVNEQLEEVSSMETLLRMIQRAGDSGLLFVESYLSQHGRREAAGEEGEST